MTDHSPSADLELPWHARRVGREFQNIGNPRVRGLADVLLWKLGGGPKEGVARHFDAPFSPRVAPPDFAAINHPDFAAVTATWIGHSTFLLQMGGRRFLTDPHFSASCAPVPLPHFRRRSPPGLALAQLPPIDAVLLSHNHYDHLDWPTLRALGRDTPIFCPSGLGRRLGRWGFRAVTELSWSESHQFGGVRITSLPALHGSARTALDRNRTLWCGWLAEHAGRKAAFLGDTGYAPFFAEMGRALGAIDLAMIPIGAYRPFWFMHTLHLQPEEAVRVHLDLRARRSLAMHWGTFTLADDPLQEPPLLLEEALRRQGVPTADFSVLRFGETVQV